MRTCPLMLANLLLAASLACAAPAGEPVPYDAHDGYFVSNKFEPDAPASFIVLRDPQAFNAVFGVARVMRDKSHRLPANAFDSKMVIDAIRRGKAIWRFQVRDVTAADGVLTLRYTSASEPQPTAEFACPLIVSIPKAGYTAVVFVENDKPVRRIDLAAANQPAAPAWAKLYADEDWYREHAAAEQVFTGTLERLPDRGGVNILMRDHRYRLGDRSLYPARVHPELEKLVGRKVEIRGKPYDVELEGQQVSEIWPAAIRPAAVAPAADWPITLRKQDDKATVTLEADRVLFDIASPRGISGAVVERKGDRWPQAVIIRLHLRGLESFTIANGRTKIAAAADAKTTRQHVLADGKEGPALDASSPLWLTVRALDASGKPADTIPLDGHFEITVPKALLEDTDRLTLEWIDFYR